jgi:hypothetical protein
MLVLMHERPYLVRLGRFHHHREALADADAHRRSQGLSHRASSHACAVGRCFSRGSGSDTVDGSLSRFVPCGNRARRLPYAKGDARPAGTVRVQNAPLPAEGPAAEVDGEGLVVGFRTAADHDPVLTAGFD